MPCPDALRHVFPLSPFPRQGILHGVPPLHALREVFPTRCPDLPVRGRFGPFRPLLPYLPDTPGFGPLQYPNQRPRPVRPVGRFFLLRRPRTFCREKGGTRGGGTAPPGPMWAEKPRFFPRNERPHGLERKAVQMGKALSPREEERQGTGGLPCPSGATCRRAAAPIPARQQKALTSRQRSPSAGRKRQRASKTAAAPLPAGSFCRFLPEKMGKFARKKFPLVKVNF